MSDQLLVRAVSVNPGGSAAALLLADRVIVVGLPALNALCEFYLEPAMERDIEWLSDHLLIADVASNRCRIVLWQISGEPAPVAEKLVQAPLRLVTSLGSVVLAMGKTPGPAAVLRKTADSFSLTTFPTRRTPLAAGQCHGKALVGHQGAIEEWDLEQRTGGRTWKLQPSTVPLFVGGTERALWLVPKQHLRQVDVIPLINRGQSRQHVLPEPLANVIHHRRADWLIGLGADSGRLYLIDIEGKVGIIALELGEPGESSSVALYAGRGVGLVQAHQQSISSYLIDPSGQVSEVASVTVDGLGDSLRSQADAIAAAAAAMEIADRPADELPAPMHVERPDMERTSGRSERGPRWSEPAKAWERGPRWSEPAKAGERGPVATVQKPPVVELVTKSIEYPQPSTLGPRPAALVAKPIPVMALVPTVTRRVVASSSDAHTTPPVPAASDSAVANDGERSGLPQRLDAWREKNTADRMGRRGDEQSIRGRSAVKPSTLSWRDQIAQWANQRTPLAIIPAAIAAIIDTLGLAPADGVAVAHLYGAYLNGHPGASRLSLAQRLAGDWQQALGHGTLGKYAIINYAMPALTLAPCITALLDETPVDSNRWVSASGDRPNVDRACAVAAGQVELDTVIDQLQREHVGPLLLAAEHQIADRVKQCFLEARLRGAVPVVDGRRDHVAKQLGAALALFPGASLIVVLDEAHARSLHIADDID